MIRDFLLLNRLQRWQFLNKLKENFRHKPVSFALFLLLAGGFYGGYLALAYLLSSFVYNQEAYGVLLASKLIQFLLHILVGVTLMSSLTTAMTHFYLSKDLEFQFSLPVRFSSWMMHRFWQVFLQANWMVLLFGGPLIWMYLYLSKANLAVQSLGLLAFAILSAYPVFIASLLCMGLVKVFPARRVQQVFLVLTITLVSSLILVFRYLEPEKLIGPGGLERFRGFADLVNLERHEWNPAMWAYNAIASLSQGEWTASIAPFAMLLALFGAFTAALVWTARRLYRASWDRALQSMSGEAGVGEESRRPSRISLGLSHPRWSQETREVLLFMRDPSQWSQAFVLAALLGLYLISATKIPNDLFPNAMYALSIGNLAFVAFISLSIASRFIFTSFSADGQAIWLMKTAPDGWARFVRGKFVVFGAPILLFAQVLAGLWAVILGLSLEQIGRLALFCLWDVTVMLSLALSFGMLYITPNIENPLKLIVSRGGFLLMAAGLFITALHAFLRLGAANEHWNQLQMYIGLPDLRSGAAPWYFAGLLTLEAFSLAWLIRRGLTHLRRGEY